MAAALDSVHHVSETVPMVTVSAPEASSSSNCYGQLQSLSPIVEEPQPPQTPPSVADDEDGGSGCDSSEERFTEVAATSCELQPSAQYPLINGSIVWINKPSIFCCSAKIDPLSMPCELQQFQVSHSEYCEVVDLLRRDPKVRCATLLFNRVFQYSLLIGLSLVVWTAGTLGWRYNGHRSDLGIGMFFIIAWFFFITGLLAWKLLRERMSNHSRRLNVHVNKLLMRRKMLLTVLDYEYLSCSCNILTVAFLYFDPEPCLSHMMQMFDQPELLAKARFSRKLTRIIDQIRRTVTSNDPSSAALLGAEMQHQQPPQPQQQPQQPSSSLDSSTAATAMGLRGLPAAQKKALAKFLFLSYSSLYCNWLLRHKLPRPRAQRHTQTNIPCVCQLAETLNFGQECLLSNDNAV